mmetsp:Transcript_21438/g.85280  ORF Transcript_21438/g.85280 Transcript_21438/m.85280 type:complete len:279 (+) Transcript_21438:129-965(+)
MELGLEGRGVAVDVEGLLVELGEALVVGVEDLEDVARVVVGAARRAVVRRGEGPAAVERAGQARVVARVELRDDVGELAEHGVELGLELDGEVVGLLALEVGVERDAARRRAGPRRRVGAREQVIDLALHALEQVVELVLVPAHLVEHALSPLLLDVQPLGVSRHLDDLALRRANLVLPLEQLARVPRELVEVRRQRLLPPLHDLLDRLLPQRRRRLLVLLLLGERLCRRQRRGRRGATGRSWSWLTSLRGGGGGGASLARCWWLRLRLRLLRRPRLS